MNKIVLGKPLQHDVVWPQKTIIKRYDDHNTEIYISSYISHPTIWTIKTILRISLWRSLDVSMRSKITNALADRKYE